MKRTSKSDGNFRRFETYDFHDTFEGYKIPNLHDEDIILCYAMCVHKGYEVTMIELDRPHGDIGEPLPDISRFGPKALKWPYGSLQDFIYYWTGDLEKFSIDVCYNGTKISIRGGGHPMKIVASYPKGPGIDLMPLFEEIEKDVLALLKAGGPGIDTKLKSLSEVIEEEVRMKLKTGELKGRSVADE